MAVAKRQGREKPMKMEQRKVPGPGRGPQVKPTALLDSRTGLGGGEKAYKKRSQN